MLPWPAPCSSPVRLPFLCGLLPPQGQTETDSCTRSGKGGRGGEGRGGEGGEGRGWLMKECLCTHSEYDL